MNPASLVPTVEPILVHWAWIDVMLVLTFTIHILFMNALFGGGVIALVNSVGTGEPTARNVSRKLPTILALTINFGVSPLLFLQTNYGHLDYSGSVLMGGWWLAVIPLLLLAYYSLYIYDFRYDTLRAGRPISLVLALMFLFYVAFMFSNNMTIMLRPQIWVEYFTGESGIVLNLKDKVLYPRFLHFMTAALAVGGLFIALLGRWHKRDEFIKTGMKWFVRVTVLNIGVGLWFLMSLPREIMFMFLGGHSVATATLLASICGAGGILYFGAKRAVIPSTIITIVTVLLMVITRHFLRMFYLAPYFSVQDIPVVGQYSPLIMFLVSLMAVIGICTWVVTRYLKAEGRP